MEVAGHMVFISSDNDLTRIFLGKFRPSSLRKRKKHTDKSLAIFTAIIISTLVGPSVGCWHFGTFY